MPLAAFPKRFGLTELKKGYFSHRFNTEDHQVYMGPVPAIDYYMPEIMSPKQAKRLKHGTESSATTKSSLIFKNNCWPTANQMSAYKKVV